MNRKELLDSVLQSHPEFSTWSIHQADIFLNRMLENIKEAVKRGEEVSLIGFGTFSKVKRNARIGTHPATGKPIKIKEKVVPKFRAGQAFKDYL